MAPITNSGWGKGANIHLSFPGLLIDEYENGVQNGGVGLGPDSTYPYRV